jgi:hypothetical protein
MDCTNVSNLPSFPQQLIVVFMRRKVVVDDDIYDHCYEYEDSFA